MPHLQIKLYRRCVCEGEEGVFRGQHSPQLEPHPGVSEHSPAARVGCCPHTRLSQAPLRAAGEIWGRLAFPVGTVTMVVHCSGKSPGRQDAAHCVWAPSAVPVCLSLGTVVFRWLPVTICPSGFTMSPDTAPWVLIDHYIDFKISLWWLILSSTFLHGCYRVFSKEDDGSIHT